MISQRHTADFILIISAVTRFGIILGKMQLSVNLRLDLSTNEDNCWWQCVQPSDRLHNRLIFLAFSLSLRIRADHRNIAIAHASAVDGAYFEV